MKVPGLEGDYCPTCAGVLQGRLADPKKVLVLCGSICHTTLQASGDYDRLNAPEPARAPAPMQEPPEAPKAEKKSERRHEERDPGEEEQHKAEKAGLVKP